MWPGILFATSTGNIHCIGPGDDHNVPQQRSGGNYYNLTALKRSRHIAWFEAVKIMSLRTGVTKDFLRTCGKSTSISQTTIVPLTTQLRPAKRRGQNKK